MSRQEMSPWPEVVHDGHLHVEAVAAPLLPLGPRDGELVALLHHAHGDTRPALTGAGHDLSRAQLSLSRI